MKLWLKISLICAAVLLLVVGACSALLLEASKDKILSIAEENAKVVQSNLICSFTQMMALYGKKDLGQLEKKSLAVYCFKQFSAETSVLVVGGETIYSNLVFDPQLYMTPPRQDMNKPKLANIGGTSVLILGDRADIPSVLEKYDIYYVQDITNVYGTIQHLIWEFGAVSLGCIVVGVALIIALVSYATRPVKELGASVRRIALGEYAERAMVESKDEIGELARDFNSMAEAVQAHVEKLREAALRQQLFIGGLTHELKTPLTSVIGHAETLLYTKMPPEAAENSLFTIHEQCRWLERLTEKLLKLVTLQEGIGLKEEPVAKLLEATQASVGELLGKRGVLLEIECDTDTLPMDFDMMLSLLANLVDNASKASNPGQTVILRAHGRTIEVEDRGAGIPAEELSRVTEPFYRVDKSRSKKLGGLGLGLALVKRIADAHGAEIRIKSELGRGTTVSALFPE